MRRFLVVAVLIMLSACVPNRKLVLMQKNDVNVKLLPKDSIVRTHVVDTFQYKIQANDILYIRFQSLTEEEFDFFSSRSEPSIGGSSMGNPLLMGELVDENGEVPFPVIGKVRVGGLTVFQAQDTLQRLANLYIESPLVKVRLLNYRITVLGEVEQQGTVTLSNNRVTMLEAIALAGGLAELADRSNIKLVRQKGAATEIQYINLLDENFVNSPYYYVHQNDVLIVPPLRQRPFRQYFSQNLSILVSTVSIILLTINLLDK